MSEDYVTSKPSYDARRAIRRRSADHKQKASKQVAVDFRQQARTVSFIHGKKAIERQHHNLSLGYTQTKNAKNVLIVSNHPQLPTRTVLSSWKASIDSPTNSTTTISKYEQMGKASYKEHMMNVRRSKFKPTLSTQSSVKSQMWSRYNKSMHPSRLRMKIKEKLLNNRMIKIVMYLGVLSRETKRRKEIKKLFRTTMKTIVFQTRLNEVEQRLVEFYKKQKRLQMETHKPMLEFLQTADPVHRRFNPVAHTNRRHSIHQTDSKLPLSMLKSLKGWIKHYSSESSIFKLFAEKKLDKALDSINFTIEKYRAGQRIFSQGSTATHFYVVISGTVSIWAQKYDSDLGSQSNSENSVQKLDPYSVPKLSNVNSNGKTSHTSSFQVFYECFEKCMELKIGETFGQLAFENVDKCHHSTAIAKEHCILAAIDKDDYEKYFRNLILMRHQDTLDTFGHFKPNENEKFSMERCEMLKNIAESVSYDTAEVIHGPKIENMACNYRSQTDDVYIISQGSVCAYYFEDNKQSQRSQTKTSSLYNRTTQLKNIVRKTPLLTLAKGELLDPRFIIEKGFKFKEETQNAEESEMSVPTWKSDNIYFMATAPVILLKIKAQSFFRISRFDFWSIYQTSQSAIEFAIQQLQCQRETKIALRNQQNYNTHNLDASLKKYTTWKKRKNNILRDANRELFMKTEQTKQLEEQRRQEEELELMNDKQSTTVASDDSENSLVTVPTLNIKLPRPLPIRRCNSTDIILMQKIEVD